MAESVLEEGRYIFKCIHNGYLSTDWRGRVSCRPCTALTPKEAWTVRRVTGTTARNVFNVTSTHNGKFLCAHAWFSSVNCNRPVARTWEQWHATRTADGFVTMRSAHGSFLVCDEAGTVFQTGDPTGVLEANWMAVPCPQDVVQGAHEWVPMPFSSPTWCDFCGSFIWGLGIQGYHCGTCSLTVHRSCISLVGDTCNVSKEFFGPSAKRLLAQQQKEPTREELAERAEKRKTLASAVCVQAPPMDEQSFLLQSCKDEEQWLQQRSDARASRVHILGGDFNPFFIENYSAGADQQLQQPVDFGSLLFGSPESEDAVADGINAAADAAFPQPAPTIVAGMKPAPPPPSAKPTIVVRASLRPQSPPAVAVPGDAVAIQVASAGVAAAAVASAKRASVSARPIPQGKEQPTQAQVHTPAKDTTKRTSLAMPKTAPTAQGGTSDKEKRKAQLEAVLKRGAMGPMAQQTKGASVANAKQPGSRASAYGLQAMAQQPQQQQPPRPTAVIKVEFVGDLGIPVSNGDRLEHVERSRGPRNRRRPTAV